MSLAAPDCHCGTPLQQCAPGLGACPHCDTPCAKKPGSCKKCRRLRVNIDRKEPS